MKKQITAVEDGKKYWVSQRLVSCEVFLFRKSNTGIEVCIVKRKDMGGRWCCPFSYLDVNETGEECALKELHEETGISIPLEGLALINVSTSPKEYAQNVCLEYVYLTEEDSPINVEPTPINKDKVDTVMWVDIQEIKKYRLGYNHANKCLSVIQKLLFYGMQLDLVE